MTPLTPFTFAAALMDYRTVTSDMQPLNLSSEDTVVFSASHST
jgi:hypothetical protein